MDNLDKAERTIRNFSKILDARERGIRLHKLYESLIDTGILRDSVNDERYIEYAVNDTNYLVDWIEHKEVESTPATKEEIKMLKEAGLDMFMFDV